MKLSEYLEDYYTFSGKASDNARTAAFAGLAAIWLFKIDAQPVPRLPNELVLPAALFVIGLALDLIHYVVASCIWGVFHWYHSGRRTDPADDPEINHSAWLAFPVTFLFWAKIIVVISAYFFLAKFIADKWWSTAVA